MQPFYHRKSDLNQEITPYVCWFFGSNYSSTPGLTSGQFSNSQGNLVWYQYLLWNKQTIYCFVSIMSVQISYRMLFQALESVSVPKVKSLLGVPFSGLLPCFKHLLDKTLSNIFCLFFFFLCILLVFVLTRLSDLDYLIPSPIYAHTEPSILCCTQK